jgi:tripartite-type tricarboxylate transporter receptor subunit TctC
MKTFGIAKAATALALFALATTATAQYPTRPVRILHPFGVGGGSDLVTRVVVQKLSENTGQSFIVENRTGAGGRIAYEAGAKAVGDGYTLVTGETTYCILGGLYGGALPWDHANDLIPVTVFAQTPFVIVVNPRLGVTTLRDFIERAKANPGKFNYGSAGVGSNNHIFGELFKREAGIDMAHIPYKGMGDAITGMFTGSVDLLVVGTAPVVQHINAGKMVPLAIASSKRSPALPNVPSVVEAGLPKFIVGNWFGLLAPKGTPTDVVSWLHKEVVRALAAPDVRERFAGLGVEPSGISPEELGVVMRDETERWTSVIKAAGIKPE